MRRVSNLTVTDIVTANGEHGGEAIGAVALDIAAGEPVTIAAKAVIIAAGGLTRIYRRNSASANIGGDGYALALRAGADWSTWSSCSSSRSGIWRRGWSAWTRSCGTRSATSSAASCSTATWPEFLADYGSDESVGYTTPRDIATYAIEKEVAAGRGSPHGGVYLSFAHVPREALQSAFGPVIERLAKNGIDLGRMPVEVAPIAHYHMGGIAVDECMRTGVPGLYAAGKPPAAPTAPTGCRAMRSPRRWCSASGPAVSPPVMPPSAPQAGTRVAPARRSSAFANSATDVAAMCPPRRCSTGCARRWNAMSDRSAPAPGSAARWRASPN